MVLYRCCTQRLSVAQRLTFSVNLLQLSHSQQFSSLTVEYSNSYGITNMFSTGSLCHAMFRLGVEYSNKLAQGFGQRLSVSFVSFDSGLSME